MRGALVTVSEYGENHLNDRAFSSLPRRPSSFRLSRQNFGPHECFGDGYNFQFRQRDRALIAHVALDPETVHSAARRKAQRVVNSIALP